ncbi:hypothetical protein MSG28_004841 [Choristoneura fumiferana]|uniref:Uncharacterized protein n=1 Tax=Choristoneura fumiferana TaxID=7141 RepID=A0ACC0K7T6_CHOFU|nr:hypothetical protein MSG28_004841 [Choristoneura fumiferana]
MELPEDPGGTAPDIGHNVTIVDGSSTDGSCSQDNINRRKRHSVKTCRHCNKKRSRQRHGEPLIIKEDDCVCNIDDSRQRMHSIFAKPAPKPQSQHTISTADSMPATVNDSVPAQLLSNSNSTSTAPQPVGRLMYQKSDVAPFNVHVQRMQTSENDNVSLHPVVFGKFLRKNNVSQIVNGSLKRIGRNRVTISFSDFQAANNFLTNPALSASNYKTFIPTFSVTRLGIVRGVPSEWSEEEVLENISVPIGCGPILKVRRLKRKVIESGVNELKPTESVVLTFDGQVLPKRIFMCYAALPVDLYIYPTIQCYNCCRFGHVREHSDEATCAAALAKIMVETADNVFPVKKVGGNNIPSPPWWDSECTTAAKGRKEAELAYRESSTNENFDIVLDAIDKAKKLFKKKKFEGWRNFCLSVSPNTNPSVVWNNIKRFRSAFKEDCSSNLPSSLTDEFLDKLAPPTVPEFIPLSPVLDLSGLNGPFTLLELKGAICKTKDSAPGPDVSFGWVPSHCDISGNVIADRLANEAVKDGDLFPYRNYSHDLAALAGSSLRENWREKWIESCQIKGKHYYSIQPSIPSKPWFGKTKFGKRATCCLIRMRLGHVCTPDNLAKFKLVESGVCSSNEFIKEFLNSKSADEQLKFLKQYLNKNKEFLDEVTVEFLVLLFWGADAKHPVKGFLKKHITESRKLEEPFTQHLIEVIKDEIKGSADMPYGSYISVMTHLDTCIDKFPPGAKAVSVLELDVAMYLLQCLESCVATLNKEDGSGDAKAPLAPTEINKIYDLAHLALRLLLYMIQKVTDANRSELRSMFGRIRAVATELMQGEEVPMDTKSVSGIVALNLHMFENGPDSWVELLDKEAEGESGTVALCMYSAVATAVPRPALLEPRGARPALLVLTDRVLDIGDRYSSSASHALAVARTVLAISKALAGAEPCVGGRLAARLAGYCWSHLDHHMDSVRHLAVQTLANVVAAAVHMEKEGCSPIIIIITIISPESSVPRTVNECDTAWRAGARRAHVGHMLRGVGRRGAGAAKSVVSGDPSALGDLFSALESLGSTRGAWAARTQLVARLGRGLRGLRGLVPAAAVAARHQPTQASVSLLHSDSVWALGAARGLRGLVPAAAVAARHQPTQASVSLLHSDSVWALGAARGLRGLVPAAAVAARHQPTQASVSLLHSDSVWALGAARGLRGLVPAAAVAARHQPTQASVSLLHSDSVWALGAARGLRGLVPAAAVAARHQPTQASVSLLHSDSVWALGAARGLRGLVPAAAVAARHQPTQASVSLLHSDSVWALGAARGLRGLVPAAAVAARHQPTQASVSLLHSDSVWALGAARGLRGLVPAAAVAARHQPTQASCLGSRGGAGAAGLVPAAAVAARHQPTQASVSLLHSDSVWALGAARGLRGLVPAAAVAARHQPTQASVSLLHSDSVWALGAARGLRGLVPAAAVAARHQPTQASATLFLETLLKRYTQEASPETVYEEFLRVIMDAARAETEPSALAVLQGVLAKAVLWDKTVLDYILPDKYQLHAYEGSDLKCILLVLGVVRKSDATYNYDILRQLHATAYDPDDEIRILALALVSSSPSSTAPLESEELDFVLSWIRHNINAQAPAFRQLMMAHMKKILRRLGNSQRFSSTRLFNAAASFSGDLRVLCFGSLVAGASHGRRACALQLLAWLPSPDEMIELPRLVEKKKLYVYGRNLWWSKERAELLYNVLEDTYEANKALALEVLKDCPPEFISKIEGPGDECLERLVRQASCVKPTECVSASYKLLLLFRRADTVTLDADTEGYPMRGWFCVVSRLVRELRAQTARARDPLAAARDAPMFGLLHCIHRVICCVDAQAIAGHAGWSQLVADVIAACAQVNARAEPVVSADSPEGLLPDSHHDACSDDGRPVTAQMVLMCAWRSVKETSLLLGTLVSRLALEGEGAAWTLSAAQVEAAGAALAALLARARHRGAFEQAYVGLTAVLARYTRGRAAQGDGGRAAQGHVGAALAALLARARHRGAFEQAYVGLTAVLARYTRGRAAQGDGGRAAQGHVGAALAALLARARHRGAFEQAYVGLTAVLARYTRAALPRETGAALPRDTYTRGRAAQGDGGRAAQGHVGAALAALLARARHRGAFEQAYVGLTAVLARYTRGRAAQGDGGRAAQGHVGAALAALLARARHRGAFEQAYVGLTAVLARYTRGRAAQGDGGRAAQGHVGAALAALLARARHRGAFEQAYVGLTAVLARYTRGRAAQGDGGRAAQGHVGAALAMDTWGPRWPRCWRAPGTAGLRTGLRGANCGAGQVHKGPRCPGRRGPRCQGHVGAALAALLARARHRGPSNRPTETGAALPRDTWGPRCPGTRGAALPRDTWGRAAHGHVGAALAALLARARHRGAFEQAYVGLTAVLARYTRGRAAQGDGGRAAQGHVGPPLAALLARARHRGAFEQAYVGLTAVLARYTRGRAAQGDGGRAAQGHVGAALAALLARARHRGAFEQAYVGLTAVLARYTRGRAAQGDGGRAAQGHVGAALPRDTWGPRCPGTRGGRAAHGHVGAALAALLARARHRGAFEQAYVGLTAVLARYTRGRAAQGDGGRAAQGHVGAALAALLARARHRGPFEQAYVG